MHRRGGYTAAQGLRVSNRCRKLVADVFVNKFIRVGEKGLLAGVYEARKKDGSIYYRSSITFRGKHISLGSFATENEAHRAYMDASMLLDISLLSDPRVSIEDCSSFSDVLSFDKMVTLINFRDNGMYIPTPIYLRKNYFSYYLDAATELKFDIDDLFYYSSHRILRRQGHLYVNDYGMQVTLQSRYGIRNHAVCGRDYRFVNEDDTDFRYSNIEVINPYYGVFRYEKEGKIRYRVKIHINGDHTIGTYRDEVRAAIAYNKAADLAKQAGIHKNFPQNYIEELSGSEYADLYSTIKLSKRYLSFLEQLSD